MTLAVPPPAAAPELRACGLPPQLVVDWPERLLAAFGLALRRYRSFRLALESCLACGACGRACAGRGDAGGAVDLPGSILAPAREIYARHFAPAGAPLRRLIPPPPPGAALLRSWYGALYACTLCRRCAAACPLGIDPSLVVLAGREILARVGLVPAALAKAVAAGFRSGNGLGLGPDSWLERCRTLEAWLEQTTGRQIPCPVDEYGAEVLLIPAAADLAFHQGTFLGYAKAFHAAGVSWTTSTYAGDADNPGLYLDFRNLRLLNRRVREAVRELRPRLVVWGESGSGWWVARNFSQTLGESWEGEDCLELKAPVHILEWTARLLDQGAFDGKLKREANDARNVTYHDPCHLVRSAPLRAEPRRILRACCNFFSELPGGGTERQDTPCCGGGGGLWGPELREARLGAFAPLARRLEAARGQGCNFVATACDQCKSALLEGMSHYQIPMQRGGIMELMGNALYPAAGGEQQEDPA